MRAGYTVTPNSIDSLQLDIDPGFSAGMAMVMFFMMFTIALSLRLEDFRALRDTPRPILGGVGAQILLLPALTLCLVMLWRPPASIALGMFVVAACPGGNMSNVFTHYSRGHTAYSVSLTAISSSLSALVTPLSIYGWAIAYPPTRDLLHRIEVDGLTFLVNMLALLAAPMALGMALRHFRPGFARRAQRIFSPIAIAGIGGLVVVGLWMNWDLLFDFGGQIAPIAIVHNALAFGLGALAGRALFLIPSKRRALTFEVGIQNAGLGLLILLSQFQGLGGAAAVTAFWGVWHLIAGAGLVGLFRLLDWRRNTSRGGSRDGL